MKIAILSFYSGQIERGVENWTHEIASRLSETHKVTVFQNESDISKKNYEVIPTKLKVNWNAKDTRGTFIRRIFFDYWSLIILFSTLKLIPVLFKRRYDIVIPTNGGWQPALIRLLVWIRGGKIIQVGHSGRGWDERNNLLCFPDVFVALSKPALEWARKINPFIKNFIIISDGIDLKTFTPKGKKAKVNLPRPIVLVVGAPEKGKRLDLAIKAVSKIKGCSLLILGGKYEENMIRNLGRRYLKNNFIIKQVPYKSIADYYRSADIFTLPSSKNEAFGMVYLEAMACGLPVVATDDELRKEIVGDAGILVEPTDIDAYAEALKKALNVNWEDKPRKQAEKFSWDMVVSQYETLFNSLYKSTKL